MRILLPVAALLAACSGNDTRPTLVRRLPPATLAVSSTNPDQPVTIDVVPGTLPLPKGELTVCLYELGGATAAAVPPGHCSLTAPGCRVQPTAQPFCATAPDCSQGCSLDFTFSWADKGLAPADPHGALQGTWSWQAAGPTPLLPSDPIAVTQN